jgi:hypothetical protein
VTLTVTAVNDAPAVGDLGNRAVNEGSAVTASGSFADADAGDSWTGTVDYGDGAGPQPLALTASKTFSLNKVYGDNGLYTVTVRITDAAGEAHSNSFGVTVNNVAPAVTLGGPTAGSPGSALTFTGSFTDPGTDTWTATIDFGDGTGPQPLVLNADKTFTATKTYATAGSFTVTVIVTDDDGGSGTATRAVTIAATGEKPSAVIEPDKCDCDCDDRDGRGRDDDDDDDRDDDDDDDRDHKHHKTQLVVRGTSGDDRIEVVNYRAGGQGHVRVLFNGVPLEIFENGKSIGFDAHPTHRIIVHGLGGDDFLSIGSGIDWYGWIYGGAGDDMLILDNRSGGIMWGGDGEDILTGSKASDILIGGRGSDVLNARGNDDLLIAGYTAYDEPTVRDHDHGWCDILGEWSDGKFARRVRNIRSGGGDVHVFKLGAKALFDDGVADLLTGGSGRDWFFYNRSGGGVLDTVTDGSWNSEERTDI